MTCLLAGLPTTGLVAGSAPPEYRLKAAFLPRFSQFVEWPSHTWDGGTAVELCVLQPSPFGTVLEELVAGEAVRGRPLVVREVTARGALDTCHLLFVAASHGDAALPVLRQLTSKPVLTVGDADGFLEDGGIIVLRIVDRRVRFEIDAAAAARAGLHLSSQLLRLAMRVRGGPS